MSRVILTVATREREAQSLTERGVREHNVVNLSMRSLK